MKAKNVKSAAFLLLVILFIVSSCRKQYDTPPISDLPVLTQNMTIQALKDSLGAAQYLAFDTSSTFVIGGVVVADDRSGNFYKTLIIQDSTGGISIPIDGFDLYNEYPVGRYVFVRMAGLYAVRDGNVVIVSSSSNASESRLPQATYRNFVIGGSYGNTVTPAIKTFGSLTFNDLNTLVTIENVEFAACFAGAAYANASNPSSGVNVDLNECTSGGTQILRNSDFSDFAAQLMPTGNGSITVIYSSYNSSPQLLIRDPSDINFTNARCVALPTQMPIDSVRMLFDNGTTVGPANRKIEGIVISDLEYENIDYKSIAVQDESGRGIVCRFLSSPTGDINLGDKVRVDIGGQALSEYNGLLQVNNVPNEKACVVSSGNETVPTIVTISQINADIERYESTLVTIKDATISGGTTYGSNFGNLTLDDGTGTMTLRTITGNFPATFASESVPTGTVSVTGVISQFNTTNQISIRNTTDVQ